MSLAGVNVFKLAKKHFNQYHNTQPAFCMDDPEEQLLREFKFYSATSTTSFANMTSESDEPLTPDNTSPQQDFRTSTSIHNPMEALQSSLITGKFSDLTVIHGERRWKAHKVIVCSQSTVLESMIEDVKGSALLYLTDYDYDAVCLLIEYFYTNTYNISSPQPPAFGLPIHAKVFNLAISLHIPGLEALATNFYQQVLMHLSDLEVFFSAVVSVYATTTVEHPGLRQALAEIAAVSMNQMIGEEGVRKRFHETTSRVEEFQRDVMAVLISGRSVDGLTQTLCDECGADGEGYSVDVQCRGCGEMKRLDFC